MKKFGFSFLFLFLALFVHAQLPEDALRMSYFHPTGTARQQSIGGAMGSLGGEVSSLFVNPAGLGLIKTRELVFSPGWSFSNNTSTYLSTSTKSAPSNRFVIGTSGIVYGMPESRDENGKTSSMTLALGVNRMADFNGHLSYQGNNTFSSAAEAYAEEFNSNPQPIDQAIRNPYYSYGTRMALYTYLIDTANGSTGANVVQPLNAFASNGQIGQLNNISTSGGATEIALGIAGQSNDKWYWGLSVGVPIINYQQNSEYTESDLSGDLHNNFSSYTYTESYSSSGVGVNARIGGIFRPNLNWRAGLTVVTPTFYSLTDRVSSTMTTNTEDYAGTQTVTSAELDQAAGVGNSIEYNLQTPWRLIASGSYIFPGQQTKGSMGFITADIEYIAYRSSRFSLPADDNGYSDDSYYQPLNNTVKSYYKNSFTFRMGAEYKLDQLALRAGGSYTMDPYASGQLNSNRSTIGGGIGYRKSGIYIDVAYVQSFLNDVSIPYRLSSKDNVFATVKQTTGNILLTVGYKF